VAFEFSRLTVDELPGSRLVVFRGNALEVIDTAARPGLEAAEPAAAAIGWAGGRRPEPPAIEVDLLGSLVQRSVAGIDQDDPTVLMRSVMRIGTSDARFAFLFAPQLGAVESLLAHLGVGAAGAALSRRGDRGQEPSRFLSPVGALADH
jgi:hypothetical protein